MSDNADKHPWYQIDLDQTFFINRDSGITAKEAFNLMEGAGPSTSS